MGYDVIDWLQTEWTTADGEVWTYLDYIIYIDLLWLVGVVFLTFLFGFLGENKQAIRAGSLAMLATPLGFVLLPLTSIAAIFVCVYYASVGIYDAWRRP
jgi:hypothetical protein